MCNDLRGFTPSICALLQSPPPAPQVVGALSLFFAPAPLLMKQVGAAPATPVELPVPG